MVTNYASPLPHDRGDEPMQGYPTPVTALKSWAITNQAASSVISLSDRTTVIEISAVTAPILMRWVPSTETAAVNPAASVIASGLGIANFDHIISANATRRFVVPIEKTPNPQSVMGINGANGLYTRIAWINGGAPASVMATEF